MSKLHSIQLDEIIINSPKDKVWDKVVNQFGHVNDWNPIIIDSHPYGAENGDVGDERKCEITEGNWVHERITAVKDSDEVKIEILEGGLPMIDQFQGVFIIQEIDAEKTRVRVRFEVTTTPRFMIHAMKSSMKKQFFDLLIGLKYHMETGQLVSKENFKEIKREYKMLSEGETFGVMAEAAIA